MNILLSKFLGRIIRSGNVEVIDSGGALHRFGDGVGEPVRLRFTSAAAERNVVIYPDLKLGEEFMDGGVVMEQGSLYDLLDQLTRNVETLRPSWWIKVGGAARRHLTKRLRQFNTPFRARRNIAHHYDLDGRLYSLFLDNDLQYSCAYFENDGVGLDEAQLAKKRHLAAKLDLKPGQRVLDIGSGWGGLGLYLAERADVEVVGVTLSEEQFATSNRRAAERGLDKRVRFLLRDYREIEGPFDRIVSVGMFEHVGVNHYRTFFNSCRDLLARDGVMVLHSIGRFEGPSDTSPWIQKYIFPGGYIPAMSEVVPAIERSKLKVSDVEILRLHYAKTLRLWRERFLAHREQVAALYDERFCRMWEFYLSVAEFGFRAGSLMNFQVQLVKDQHALPLTRNYMWEAEERLRAADLRAAAKPTPFKLAGE